MVESKLLDVEGNPLRPGWYVRLKTRRSFTSSGFPLKARHDLVQVFEAGGEL